jgi:dihydrodipicolinate synthase/N-acetylneuraminate lyase
MVMHRRHYVLSWQCLVRVAGLLSGLAALGFSLPVAAERPPSNVGQLLTPQQFKQRLVGPILTIPTPFTESGEIDFPGVQRMIRNALAHEATVVALTAGNSRYDQLSFDEVKQLTRVVVESVGGDGMCIAATGFWNLERVLEYVHFAEHIGASAVQVTKPNDADDQTVAQFYQDVARATQLAIVLHGEFSEDLLRRLIKIDSIVAMKEDVGLEYLIDCQIDFGERLTVFPGGFESRMLVAYPYGVRAYYSVFYQFSPQLGKQFWHAIRDGDIKAAGQFVMKYERPFAKKWSWPFWMGTIEHFGVAQRFLRPPEKALSDEQMDDVKAFWDSLGVRPANRLQEHAAEPLE